MSLAKTAYYEVYGIDKEAGKLTGTASALAVAGLLAAPVAGTVKHTMDRAGQPSLSEVYLRNVAAEAHPGDSKKQEDAYKLFTDKNYRNAVRDSQRAADRVEMDAWKKKMQKSFDSLGSPEFSTGDK